MKTYKGKVRDYGMILDFAIFIRKECNIPTSNRARPLFKALEALYVYSSDFPAIAANTKKGLETLKDEYIRGD